MSGRSKIEWTDRVWNPVSGCSKVSAGCKNCYAERHWLRLAGGVYKGRKFTDVACHPERLDAPLHWRKPARIFVNSMSDLFHPDVPEDFIFAVFAMMMRATRHTFQVLTKRPERMRNFILSQRGYSQVPGEAKEFYPYQPLPNVWLGVSVEDQATADERIPILLQTPAAVRFVSIEPLLEAVDLSPFLYRCPECGDAPSWRDSRWRWADRPQHCHGYPVGHIDAEVKTGISWVIVGGESGPNARPCNIDHVRAIVRQCKAADVRCFVKQVGSNPHFGFIEIDRNGASSIFDRKGADPAEWAEDIRVREYPR